MPIHHLVFILNFYTMPINNYGVLKGKVFSRLRATEASEHFQVLVNHNNNPHRIAINTKSSEAPSEVLYYADNDFHHEITDALLQFGIEDGFTLLNSAPGGLALDFIRRNLFDPAKMSPLPSRASGDNDDLNDQLDFFVQQAIQDNSAVIYAFGQHWKDTSGKDKYFKEISPSQGIHDIHMNQGNKAGKYFGDNGIYQDGGLLFHFSSRNRWAAVFTAFQSQSFYTDDVTGNPITEVPIPGPQQPPNRTPVSIIAAMVNPGGNDVGLEYVILLNKSNQDINLQGWQIVDKLNKKETITNKIIEAGSTIRITLSGNRAQLSNKGGNITLVNAEGIKIDGATYTESDADVQGWLIEL
jgi:uncharacterized protein YukJ